MVDLWSDDRIRVALHGATDLKNENRVAAALAPYSGHASALAQIDYLQGEIKKMQRDNSILTGCLVVTVVVAAFLSSGCAAHHPLPTPPPVPPMIEATVELAAKVACMNIPPQDRPVAQILLPQVLAMSEVDLSLWLLHSAEPDPKTAEGQLAAWIWWALHYALDRTVANAQVWMAYLRPAVRGCLVGVGG